jgi:hypothetical protein
MQINTVLLLLTLLIKNIKLKKKGHGKELTGPCHSNEAHCHANSGDVQAALPSICPS